MFKKVLFLSLFNLVATTSLLKAPWGDDEVAPAYNGYVQCDSSTAEAAAEANNALAYKLSDWHKQLCLESRSAQAKVLLNLPADVLWVIMQFLASEERFFFGRTCHKNYTEFCALQLFILKPVYRDAPSAQGLSRYDKRLQHVPFDRYRANNPIPDIGNATVLHISANDNDAVIGTYEGYVLICKNIPNTPAAPVVIHRYEGKCHSPIRYINYTPNADFIISITHNGIFALWEVNTKKLLWEKRVVFPPARIADHSDGCCAAADISPDGNLLAILTERSTPPSASQVILLDLQHKDKPLAIREIQTIGISDFACAVKFFGNEVLFIKFYHHCKEGTSIGERLELAPTLEEIDQEIATEKQAKAAFLKTIKPGSRVCCR